MKHFSFFISVLALTLAAPVGFAAPSSEPHGTPVCEKLLQSASALERVTLGKLGQAWAWVRTPKEVRRFDVEGFEASLARYLKGEQEPPRSFEQRLAYVEALLRQSEATRTEALDAVIGSRDAAARRRVALAVRRLDFERGVTSAQVEALVAELYLATEGSPYSLAYLAEHGEGAVVQGVLTRAFQERLARRGIIGALARANWLRSPGWLGRLRQSISGKRARLAMAVALNAPIVAGGGVPILPAERWTKWIDFPEALLERAALEGLDAVWPELSARYERIARADVAYQRVRPLFMAVLVALVVEHVRDELEELRRELREDQERADREVDGLINTLREQIRGYEQRVEQPSHQSVREQLFEEWKASFRERHGHDPDPNSGDYQQMRRLLLESR